MQDRRSIILTGFMATGKSLVGRRLAEKLGREFIDLDAVIEEEAGLDIPEIFRREGEARFRVRESRAAAMIVSRPGCVVATGGGAITDPGNLALFRRHGVVITLTADPETILSRIPRIEDRPMLSGEEPRERIRRLLEERAAAYARADLLLDTSGLQPDAVVARLVERLPDLGCGQREPSLETVRISLGANGYDIHVGTGLLDTLGALIRPLGLGRRVGLVTHPILHGQFGYAALARESLERAGHEVVLLTVAEGEASKSLQEVERLARMLAQARLDRGSALFAVGGGVLGDLAGFVAATLYRGIVFVDLPTTLLAQVDSSVGGKTGVNLPEGKNLLGAFHQPSLVVADVATLQTLPEREFRSGLAELTKHAMIADAELFGLLEEGAEKVARRDPDTLKRLVARSIAIKAGVVESDEREGGRRAILNFGHTVGHALEAAAGYGRITHGQAVAVGMLAATILSVRRGLCPRKDLDRFRALLDRLGLLQELPVNLQSFDNYIVSDKKMRDGVLQFVLTPGVGSVTLAPVSDLEEVRAALVDLAQYLRSRE